MNDEIKNLRTELTDATAPADLNPPHASEAGPEREAWLAFGHLLSATGPGMDERTLVRHIQLVTARRSWRRRAAIASLAASVLIVASVVWQRLRPLEPVSLPGGKNQFAQEIRPNLPRVLPEPASLKSPVANSVRVAPSAVAGDKLAWDDQLDRQLTRMQRQVRTIKRPRDTQPDPIAVLRTKIDLLGRDARSDRL